jgi:hypothetical protein
VANAGERNLLQRANEAMRVLHTPSDRSVKDVKPAAESDRDNERKATSYL